MPQITRETIQAKLDELAKAQEQALAQLNAIAGARQAYDALLTELDAPEDTETAGRTSH